VERLLTQPVASERSERHTLTITANATPENIYIRSCKVNGKVWNTPLLRHADIAGGGTIEMELSDTPTQWGMD
jgi:putative alpha-1,2-mannosidase